MSESRKIFWKFDLKVKILCSIQVKITHQLKSASTMYYSCLLLQKNLFGHPVCLSLEYSLSAPKQCFTICRTPLLNT